MGSKVGVILSLIFFVQSMLFATDLIGYQLAISKLEMHAQNIKEILIDSNGSTTKAQTYLNTHFITGSIKCINNCAFTKGEFYKFEVKVNYQAIFQVSPNKTITTTKLFMAK